MTCNHICEKYKPRKKPVIGYYISGIKRCSKCELFVTWKGIFCPCCGVMLATQPRNKKICKVKKVKRY